MLVLTRRTGETIVIGDDIRITVTLVRGDRVQLGITAPESVRVEGWNCDEHTESLEYSVAARIHCPQCCSASIGPQEVTP